MILLPEGRRYLDEELQIPYPWYTKPCLEWLETLDLNGKKIFEYGVGDSSRWYFAKGANPFGVDSSKNWWGSVRASGLPVYLTEEKEEYLNAINYYKNNFDIVVIDGDFRDECTKYALSRIRKGGYIIIDNYKQPTADLEHWPLTEVLITGMDVTIYKEEEHEDWQTAVIKIQ